MKKKKIRKKGPAPENKMKRPAPENKALDKRAKRPKRKELPEWVIQFPSFFDQP